MDRNQGLTDSLKTDMDSQLATKSLDVNHLLPPVSRGEGRGRPDMTDDSRRDGGDETHNGVIILSEPSLGV